MDGCSAGKTNCAADAFMRLISLTPDNALNASMREPQCLHSME